MTQITRKAPWVALLFGLLFAGQPIKAQSALDLRINEVLVFNDSNYVDDFGQRSAWIEIFNSAYNYVDIGGLYLTDDMNNPTKYRIPKGQPITNIAPRSYLVFWADGNESHGLLHLNFNIENSQLIALFDANGKKLIDSVIFPVPAKRDTTYGRLTDGAGSWGFLDKSTPNSSNQTEAAITGAEVFGKYDPKGVAMIAIAMGVVFTALTILFLFFKNMARMLNRQPKKAAKVELVQNNRNDEHSGEVNAAIALALFLYRDQLHDQENTVLTINKVAKTYSPWSSKIYGLRRWPRG
jgi:Na+-transporting methylmalonyl-CoA/oxaloacetate decarboxylase gamma subunit